MNIRPATQEDKPAIIALQKLSLGEAMIPKSEYLWSWKHELNPFGPSYVLLAEENNVLIGLRAFLKWNWIWNGKVYKAIRAVDTATHPDHQGKGIFKKLTLQQLESCKQDGVHFVFNTPNKISRIGYFKMGWVAQGNMPLKFKVRQPLSLVYAKLFCKNKFSQLSADPTPEQTWDPKIVELLRHYDYPNGKIATVITPEYIQWRYIDNPLFNYNYITDTKSYLLISRIKNHGFAKELRLVEFLLLDKKADPQSIKKEIKRNVYQYCKLNQINIISFSGAQYELSKSYFSWMGFLPVRPLGPTITLKDVNMNDAFEQLMVTDNWAYSLGDIELF